MPNDKLEAAKRLNEYLNILNSVKKDGLSEEYIEFVNDLNDFNNHLQQWYEQDPQSGESPKLTEEGIIRVQLAYNNMIGLAQELLNKQNCNSTEKDFNVLISFVNDMLEEDNDIIQRLDADANISLPDAVKTARSYVLNIDDKVEENEYVEKEGVKVLPVAFTGPNGIEKKGFLYDLSPIKNNEAGADDEENLKKTGKSYAVSKLGEALGLRNSLPKAEIVQIRVNNRLQNKCFVSDVYGAKIGDPETEDLFAKWANNAVTESGETKIYRPAISEKALREMFDLETLDVICGIKRKASDYAFEITNDEQGNPKLVSVKGINNNVSFGLSDDIENGDPSVKDLTYISLEMQTRISLLTDAQLKIMLANANLTDAQVNAACERLHKIQDVLNASYSVHVEKGINELEPGVPKIVAESNMDMIDFPMQVTIAKGTERKNTFTKIAKIIDNAIEKYANKDVNKDAKEEEILPQNNTNFKKATQLKAPSRDDMNDIKDQLDAFAEEIYYATPTMHINRPAFRKMNNKLEEIRNFINKTHPKENELEGLYTQLNGLCQGYIDAKGTNPYRTYGKNRLDIARRLRDFAAERVATLNSPDYKIDSELTGLDAYFKDHLSRHWESQKEFDRLTRLHNEDKLAMLPAYQRGDYKRSADLNKEALKSTLSKMIYLESVRSEVPKLNADQINDRLSFNSIDTEARNIRKSDVFGAFFKQLDGVKLFEETRYMDMPQIAEKVSKSFKAFEKEFAKSKEVKKEELVMK